MCCGVKRWLGWGILLGASLAGLVQVVREEWAFASEFRALQLGQAKVAELIQRQETITRRIHAKQQVTLALLAGRVDLFEASAWFRYFDENPRHSRDDFRNGWPGDCDEEKLCRQVIAWAFSEVQTSRSHSESECVRRRLETVLRDHQQLHGRVILPDL